MIRPVFAALVTCVAPVLVQAEVDFVHQVVPVLKQHCAACHGGKEAKGTCTSPVVAAFSHVQPLWEWYFPSRILRLRRDSHTSGLSRLAGWTVSGACSC